MNIVYLIGNGLDINFGLNTRSSDFLRYISENFQKAKYSEFAENLNKVVEASALDSNLWSDYEIALGDFSKEFKESSHENNINNYYNCIHGLNYIFYDYITEQESLANSKNIEYEKAKKFIINLNNACSDKISDTELELFNNFYSNKNSNHVSIINFNYTSIIDRILSLVFSENNDFILDLGEGERKLHIDNHIHIHGSIYDPSGMIIGVDSNNQISNFSLQEEDLIINSLNKRNINNRLRNNRIEICENIINEADIICIYGMSYGRTD